MPKLDVVLSKLHRRPKLKCMGSIVRARDNFAEGDLAHLELSVFVTKGLGDWGGEVPSWWRRNQHATGYSRPVYSLPLYSRVRWRWLAGHFRRQCSCASLMQPEQTVVLSGHKIISTIEDRALPVRGIQRRPRRVVALFGHQTTVVLPPCTFCNRISKR